MANINRVVLVGNLTKDPELRHTPSGTAVCKLRLAVNTRQKDGQTGEWGDKPNYFDVTVWGNQGESCAQYLAKGRPIGVDGRLDWREWEAQDGSKRQAVEIIADTVQFLGSRGDGRGRRRAPVRSGRGARRKAAPTSATRTTTTFPSKWHAATETRKTVRAAAAGSRWSGPAGAGLVTSARRRSTRWTGRTSTSFAATCPRRARSARAGSRARAAGTSARSQLP